MYAVQHRMIALPILPLGALLIKATLPTVAINVFGSTENGLPFSAFKAGILYSRL